MYENVSQARGDVQNEFSMRNCLLGLMDTGFGLKEIEKKVAIRKQQMVNHNSRCNLEQSMNLENVNMTILISLEISNVLFFRDGMNSNVDNNSNSKFSCISCHYNLLTI